MRVVFVFAVILLASTAFAYQVPLTEFGFEGINNTARLSTQCSEMLIDLPQIAKDETGVVILSIDANIELKANDTSVVLLKINDEQERYFWAEDFSCDALCWARIFIPEAKNNQTKIKLCAFLGGLSDQIAISKNSMIGVYDSPLLSIENVAPLSINLGDRAKMSILVSNKGTKNANVFVQFVHPDTRANVPIASFDIVEGDSSATTNILPEKTSQFDYYVKPSIASTYNMPSAALFFTNIFGEKQNIKSNHVLLSVNNPKTIDVSLVALENTQPYMFKTIIKNNSEVPFKGTAILSPQTMLQTPVVEIFVAAGAEKEIDFTSSKIVPGSQTFFATVRDENNIYSSNQITIEMRSDSIPFGIIFAVLGIIIGLAIFAWIYFTKQ